MLSSYLNSVIDLTIEEETQKEIARIENFHPRVLTAFALN